MKFYNNEIHATLMRIQQVTGASYELADSWLSRWEEKHRFWHSLNHFFGLKKLLGKAWDRDDIFLLALFHDIIYNPTRKDNELMSKELFLEELPELFKSENKKMVDAIAEAIMETRHIEPPQTELGKIFCPADLNILTHGSLAELVDYEIKICKEYQVFPYELYKEHRVNFLSNWTLNPSVLELIKFIIHRKLNIGLYAGSFDPFTIGHENILEKAERIFDKVIIGRGLNPAKAIWEYALPPRLDFHQKVYIGDFNRLTPEEIPMEQRELHMASALMRMSNVTLIRGLRGASDLEMEKIQQVYIEQMMGIQPLNTVYITCDRQYEHISSSAFKQVAKVDAATAAKCCPNGYPRVWRELGN